jgi:hypothetical protein
MRIRSWQSWCTLQWATASDMLAFDAQVYGGRGGRTGRGLLLAEALHALGSHVGRLWVCVRGRGGRDFAVVVVFVKLLAR